MKNITLILLLLIGACAANASITRDSTWYRGRQGNLLKYIMLPSQPATDAGDVTVTQVTLKKDFLLAPKIASFTIDIYNFLYKDKLAVFSLMPSYKSITPVWTKINIDSINNDKLIDVNHLHQLIDAAISHYPISKANSNNNLKYFTYALLKKESDGWYVSSTDCFTEFFEIINDPSKTASRSYQINLQAKQQSISEYESAYRRKFGYYSTNTKSLKGYNEDIANGDLLFHSYTETYRGDKTYHFWILSDWTHDGASPYRGMDRFIFKPDVGVTSASYDFFIPEMYEHWIGVYLKKNNAKVNTTIIHAPLMNEIGEYYEPYFKE